MITFTKQIGELECYKNIGENQNVVHTVVWTLIAQHESGLVEAFGMRCDVPLLANSGFVNYQELTEETVLGWIDLYTPALKMQAAKKYLESTINERLEKITLSPPWLTDVIGA